MRSHIALMAVAVLLCSEARADWPPLPPQLAFVESVLHIFDESFGYPGEIHKDWSEFQFANGSKQGKLWQLQGTVEGKPEDRWNPVKAAFVKAGWTVATEAAGGNTSALLHLASPESWAQVSFREWVTVTMIEVGANPLSLVLSPPAATPEKMEVDKGDFPYLKPIAGVTFRSGAWDERPFWVHLQGAPQPEMVAERSLVRNYAPPDSLSNLEFIDTYRAALTKAGWDIVSESNSADAMIIAHYAKRGRDLWANLHLGGQSLSISVAERGTDLKSELAKDCHVALYGILFDFNKSTLQPASDPVLEKVLALLKKSPSLELEIQGHTDNVGDAAYNQTLSEARAATVVQWLQARGVGAKRLSSRGYGKSQPVADNGTDLGRAKNRRVELADPHCKSARK